MVLALKAHVTDTYGHIWLEYWVRVLRYCVCLHESDLEPSRSLHACDKDLHETNLPGCEVITGMFPVRWNLTIGNSFIDGS